MATYRLNFIGGDGRLAGWRCLEFADDAAVIAASYQHLDGRVVELWVGERLVKAFPADPSRRRFPYWVSRGG
jgi:hypothetical protein